MRRWSSAAVSWTGTESAAGQFVGGPGTWASPDGKRRARTRIEKRIEIETTIAEAGEETAAKIRLTADNAEGVRSECYGCATEIYVTEILKQIPGAIDDP